MRKMQDNSRSTMWYPGYESGIRSADVFFLGDVSDYPPGVSPGCDNMREYEIVPAGIIRSCNGIGMGIFPAVVRWR